MASSSAPSTEEIHQPHGLSPSNSDLVTSLEFLSFMKTDQIVPFKSSNNVIIPALLNNLSKGKHHSDKDIAPVQQLFDKVQGDLVDINGTFKRLKEWEDRLNMLTKSLILYDWEGFCSAERTKPAEVLQNELSDIDKMVSDLKVHTFSAQSSNSSTSPPTPTPTFQYPNADFSNFDSDDNPTIDFTRSCRACLLKEGSLQQLSTYANHENLKVLFNVHVSYLEFPSELFLKMKNIVVLHLGNWSCSGDNIIEAADATFLEGLSDTTLLKCLSLNGISGITELSGSICKLNSDLMILDLKAC
ncbi:hypothetical protein ACSBR2_017127 [Camellia fascicularis]